ncbi:MAG: hypothetical protein ACT4N9_06780 [Paracoccaceae bacterium]
MPPSAPPRSAHVELARLRAQMRLLQAREAELLALLAQDGPGGATAGQAPRPGWPLRRLTHRQGADCPA